MTQLQLAEQRGVTDKAVSKWERDVSYPDVSSFPKLAEVLGVSIDELMQVKTEESMVLSFYFDFSLKRRLNCFIICK